MTTTISLDIPQSPHAKDIQDALPYFVRFSHSHPEEMEDIILGMRMRETDDEPTISLADFLRSSGE
ncbi:MAG: hypothetical protein PHY14_01530 [Candidatus Gracilibacteria bacterium]|nr:hypothetical protein [Candidatus Gracilibacteria bacterium]